MLCLFPMQNPQADHCRLQEVGTYCQESRRLDQWVPELVLQERWRIQHPHTRTKTRALWIQILNWTVVAHAGMACSGLGWAVLTDKQKPRTPFQWLVKPPEWRLVYKGCTVQKTQTEADSHPDHIVFTFSVKLDLSFYFMLLFGYLQCLWGVTVNKKSSSIHRNKSTPQLVPGRKVFFYWLDRNAVIKLCPTFLCILTWESPRRERRCVWIRGMRVQYFGLSLEKTGRAACAWLKWAAQLITMETEMEVMFKLKSHRIYWPKKLQKGHRTWCFWSAEDTEWAV